MEGGWNHANIILNFIKKTLFNALKWAHFVFLNNFQNCRSHFALGPKMKPCNMRGQEIDKKKIVVMYKVLTMK
jgi:hypothetical protein